MDEVEFLFQLIKIAACLGKLEGKVLKVIVEVEVDGRRFAWYGRKGQGLSETHGGRFSMDGIVPDGGLAFFWDKRYWLLGRSRLLLARRSISIDQNNFISKFTTLADSVVHLAVDTSRGRSHVKSIGPFVPSIWRPEARLVTVQTDSAQC